MNIQTKSSSELIYDASLPKSNISFFKPMAKLTAILAVATAMLGCDEDYGSGLSVNRDNFSVSVDNGIVGPGYISEQLVAVRSGRPYDIVLQCSNDGGSDRVAITVNGQEIGVYTTVPYHQGGNGWYQEQYSPAFSFIPYDDQVVVGIRVKSTDQYGVWPQRLTILRQDQY